jgi:hypothetical protein
MTLLRARSSLEVDLQWDPSPRIFPFPISSQEIFITDLNSSSSNKKSWWKDNQVSSSISNQLLNRSNSLPSQYRINLYSQHLSLALGKRYRTSQILQLPRLEVIFWRHLLVRLSVEDHSKIFTGQKNTMITITASSPVILACPLQHLDQQLAPQQINHPKVPIKRHPLNKISNSKCHCNKLTILQLPLPQSLKLNRKWINWILLEMPQAVPLVLQLLVFLVQWFNLIRC